MKNDKIVEVSFGDLDGKEGLWLKLNEPVPFKWKKMDGKYFLDLTKRGEKKWSVEEKRIKHKNAYKPWTAEEDDLLERLFAEGTKVKEISVQLGRNRGAINSRINKLELREIYS